MAITGIHHIVIRVSDLDASTEHWSRSFGLAVSRTAENPSLGVKQAFFDLDDGTFIELVAPLTSDAPVAKALESRGEGLHLISMSVNDVDTTIDGMQAQNVAILGQPPGPRFVHPKSASGVMLGLFGANHTGDANVAPESAP